MCKCEQHPLWLKQPDSGQIWNDRLDTGKEICVSDWGGNKLMYQFDNVPMYQWNSRSLVEIGMTGLLQRRESA
jgi:hypothetical protein